MKTSLCGWLLLASLLLSLTGNPSLYTLSGLLAWSAGVALFFTIPPSKRRLSLVLFTLGTVCFLVAYHMGFSLDLWRIASVNQLMLSLLISVSYLRLVALPPPTNRPLPKGPKSFVSTFIGVHLFGAIINLSAILLAGDRLSQEKALTKVQTATLSRAFSADALWSPFFIAFAAASIYAPQASLLHLWQSGMVLVAVGFMLTYWEFKGEPMKDFVGYPIGPNSLVLPALLASFVGATHWLLPEVPVILLVCFYAFGLTLWFLFWRQGFKEGVKSLTAHTTAQLPLLKNELALFLVAGYFGLSISALLEGFALDFPVSTFTSSVAALMLLGMVLASLVGVHPIISIAILGGWLGNMEVDHTLLAMTFLMAWSLSIGTSPVSGLNLALSSRYTIPAKKLFLWNAPYALKLYLACVLVLHLYKA